VGILKKSRYFFLIFIIFLILFIVASFDWEPLVKALASQQKLKLFVVNLAFQLILLSIGGFLVDWRFVIWKPNIKESALLLFAVLMILLFANVLLPFVIPPDTNQVAKEVLNLPITVIIMAIFLAPLAEEMFFRATLTKYMSPILAAVIFCLFHVSYGSIYEVILVFLLGWLLGEYYIRTRNIGTLYVVHMLINAASIGMMGGLR